jgi:hypothetical protein
LAHDEQDPRSDGARHRIINPNAHVWVINNDFRTLLINNIQTKQQTESAMTSFTPYSDVLLESIQVLPV